MKQKLKNARFIQAAYKNINTNNNYYYNEN